jgi:hypothetical protein
MPFLVSDEALGRETVKTVGDAIQKVIEGRQSRIRLMPEFKSTEIQRHKEYCPYCRSVSYDDPVGNCDACGGMREKPNIQKEKEEHPQYFIDGGVTMGFIPREDYSDWPPCPTLKNTIRQY